MDVTEKIKKLARERGWSEYRLVKESGLPTSTIANIYHRNTIPGIPTLEVLCDAFGITLSQFFSEGDMVSLSSEQSKLLEYWGKLEAHQRTALLHFISTIK